MIEKNPSRSHRPRWDGAGRLLIMVVKLVMLLLTWHTHAD
jgi:hypothetical protein